MSKKKRKERRESRQKKRKERREKRKRALKKTALVPFKGVMKKLVKRKGQEPSEDILILANQVYELYLKKNFDLIEGEDFSPADVNNAVPPIPPQLIPVVVDFIKAMIKKKKQQGTLGDKELDAEIDNAEKKMKEIKEEEDKTEKTGTQNVWIFAGIGGGLLLLTLLFFLRKK